MTITLETTYSLLIGGKLVQSQSQQTFPSHNPATGEKLADVPFGDREDVDLAVEAAKEAFSSWRKTSSGQRADLLRQLAQRLRQRFEEYALLDALDSGNPVSAMRGDVLKAADSIDYFASLASEIKGKTITPNPNIFSYTKPEPFGVVGRIIPFNHPIMFAAADLAAPLAAGNTLILKPAEQTPLSALEMGRDLRDIVPAGVVNILTGDGPTTGAAIVTHPEIPRIAFTGSVETGRKIMELAAPQVKVISLELGGKNPMIVFPDADLELAVEGAIKGMNFKRCQGQSCGSNSRLFVHEDVRDAFVTRLVEQIEAIRIGLPTDESTEMGCLVSQDQFEKVMGYVEMAKQDPGVELLTGGSKPIGKSFQDGYFVLPTLFGGVTSEMRIAQEEIFGPVACVIQWDDYDQMIGEVNSVLYGLTASVWTSNLETAFRAVSDIEAGFLWINDSSSHYEGVPFGGFKQSGIGQENSLEELLSYTRSKSVNVRMGIR